MRAVIISAGHPPSIELFKKEIIPGCFIIGVDGGANFLFDHGILPNILIGDFDSIKEEAILYFSKRNISIKKHPRDKSCTDTQLASREAITWGAKEIIFLGCMGGNRIDHTLGNLGVLRECLELNIKASLKDDHNTVTLLNKPTKIIGSKQEQFSLQAYSDVVTGLSIIGSKFELNNYDLRLGDPLTLSNEFLGKEVTIDFRGGNLLLIRAAILILAHNYRHTRESGYLKGQF